MKNQKGFGLVEGLLILVIVGILGFTGWYIYDSNNKTQDTYYNVDAANSSIYKSSKKPSAKDSTSDWVLFTPTSKTYTIKLPDGWKFYHQDNDVLIATNTDMVYASGSKAIVTEVQGGSDGLRGVIITEDPSDQSSDRFKNYEKVGPFKTLSLTGTKYLYEEKVGNVENPKGYKDYSYYFVKNGKGIYVGYSVNPTEVNHLKLIEQMISTLK